MSSSTSCHRALLLRVATVRRLFARPPHFRSRAAVAHRHHSARSNYAQPLRISTDSSPKRAARCLLVSCSPLLVALCPPPTARHPPLASLRPTTPAACFLAACCLLPKHLSLVSRRPSTSWQLRDAHSPAACSLVARGQRLVAVYSLLVARHQPPAACRLNRLLPAARRASLAAALFVACRSLLPLASLSLAIEADGLPSTAGLTIAYRSHRAHSLLPISAAPSLTSCGLLLPAR